jgi:hypothetical protein
MGRDAGLDFALNTLPPPFKSTRQEGLLGELDDLETGN